MLVDSQKRAIHGTEATDTKLAAGQLPSDAAPHLVGTFSTSTKANIEEFLFRTTRRTSTDLCVDIFGAMKGNIHAIDPYVKTRGHESTIRRCWPTRSRVGLGLNFQTPGPSLRDTWATKRQDKGDNEEGLDRYTYQGYLAAAGPFLPLVSSYILVSSHYRGSRDMKRTLPWLIAGVPSAAPVIAVEAGCEAQPLFNLLLHSSFWLCPLAFLIACLPRRFRKRSYCLSVDQAIALRIALPISNTPADWLPSLRSWWKSRHKQQYRPRYYIATITTYGWSNGKCTCMQ